MKIEKINEIYRITDIFQYQETEHSVSGTFNQGVDGTHVNLNIDGIGTVSYNINNDRNYAHFDLAKDTNMSTIIQILDNKITEIINHSE